MPAYLATSPLPSCANLMEQGIEDLHQQVAAVEALSTTTITDGSTSNDPPFISVTSLECSLPDVHATMSLVTADGITGDKEGLDDATPVVEMAMPIADLGNPFSAPVELATPTVDGTSFTYIARKDSEQSLYMSTHNTLDNFPQCEDDFTKLETKTKVSVYVAEEVTRLYISITTEFTVLKKMVKKSW